MKKYTLIVNFHYIFHYWHWSKFDRPIIYTDSLKSIQKSHNNVWENKVYSLITKTQFPIILLPANEAVGM